MNERQERPTNVTVPELILVAVGVLLFAIPIFMLKIHPDIAWVQSYLGGGRVLLVWIIGGGALYWIEKYIRKLQGRPDVSFISFDKD